MIQVDPLTQLDERLTNLLCKKVAKIQSRSKGGRFDENKISEYTMRDLLNILYGTDLEVETVSNSAGFDLCCLGSRLMVQVTSECTDDKILDCLKKTARRVLRQTQLDGYRLLILFITTDSQKTQQAKHQALRRSRSEAIDLSHIRFDFQTDIIDFNTLIGILWKKDFTPDQMTALQTFLNKWEGFVDCPPSEPDKVQSVIDQYVSNYCAPLFRHIHYPETLVTLQNMYVEPHFEGLTANTQPYKTIPELLRAFLLDSESSVLLIDGDAAIGKTSLVSWLCYHHQHPREDKDNDTPLPQNSPIICIRLRDLECGKAGPSTQSVIDYLGLQDRWDFITKYPSPTVVLDGADELAVVNGISPESTNAFLLNIYNDLRIYKMIVTSRPKVLDARMLASRIYFTTYHISLCHFDSRKREQWLNKYLACKEPVAQETQEYILNISDESADGVADTPLALYLLASCPMRADLMGNPWALYHEIFMEAITKTYYHRNGAIQQLTPEVIEENLTVVKEVAFCMYQKQNAASDRFHITREELDNICRRHDANYIDNNVTKWSYVLYTYWKRTSVGALEFYHNNIRDFFLCEYICDKLIPALQAVAKTGSWKPLIDATCLIFPYGRITGSNYQRVFSFIAWRLRYEAKCGLSGHCLYAALSLMKEKIVEFPAAVLRGDGMWSISFPEHPYLSAKQTFENILTLFQIFYNELFLRDAAETNTPIPKFSFPPALHPILHDWYQVFLFYYVVNPVGCISNLSNMKLEKFNFERLSLPQAYFERSVCTKIIFQRAELIRPLFISCEIQNTDFTDSIIKHGIFDRVIINCSNFQTATLTNTLFTDVLLLNCDFRNATIDNATMNNCHIQGKYTAVSGALLRNTEAKSCTFWDVTQETAAILRSIGFVEHDPNEIRKDNENDSKSDFI